MVCQSGHGPVWRGIDLFSTPVATARDPNIKDELRGKQPTNWICSPDEDRPTAVKSLYFGGGILGERRLDLATPNAGYLHLLIVARSDCLA